LLFGDPRKKVISDSSIRVWAALDAAKDRTILLWLRRHLVRRWIFGAGLALAGLYLLWALLSRQNPYSLLSFGECAVIIVCVWAGVKIIEFTISANSLLGAFARATLLLAIALIPIAALRMFTYSFFDSLQVRGEVTLLQMLRVIAFISVVVLTPLVLVFWLAVAVPLITVNILILCLSVAEFVARRVAEYRSPIVGISIIVGIILALLKAFI
jgi:hypothetical protein